MGHKDHHSEPYDEGTILKLDLFERYCRAWLPVFIHTGIAKSINIVDFFCGPGHDCVGVSGSPLRIASAIKEYNDSIVEKNKKVVAVFNDKKPEKVATLQHLLKNEKFPTEVEIKFDSSDFCECFESLYFHLSSNGAANLLFIDPTGLIQGEVIKKIATLKMTDFLLFFPAEHIHRFKTTPEFKKLIPGVELVRSNSPRDLVRCFADFLSSNYLHDSDYNLAHFGIKKLAGTTHGVIFGSRSYLGLDKFLHECWKIDPSNGEATFALDGDLPNARIGQVALPGIITSSKLRKFNEAFEADVLSGKIRTNKDAYIYSLRAACLPSHAKNVLSSLKKKKKISKVPPLSYAPIFREGRIEDIG